ncbi:MAG: twin transmembrane helix small protein [Parvularculaceae bacterium]|nr:twin transmembrane helix small protein [Parvularculaceae bacterium]
MSAFVFFLIPVGLLATAAILGVGIYSLAKGGAFAREHSNKLMRLRILAQGITIAIMVLFLMLIGRGPGA